MDGPPICTSLGQWHMGQTCLRYFLGLVRELGVKKAWAAGRSSRWREWAGARANPYREAQHSGGE